MNSITESVPAVGYLAPGCPLGLCNTMTMPSTSSDTVDSRQCEGCAQPIDGKPGKRFCNARCRARASRRREKERMQTILSDLKDTVAKFEDLVGRS